MSWMDSLRAASFRGVGFEVYGSNLGGGRRTVVHEIPRSDRAVTDDTGRRPRTVSFDAFVIGDGATAAATALLAALEAGGPGLLIHPVHGPLTVSVDTYQLTDSWADGDALSFSLSFVEAGDLDFLPSLDLGSILDSAIDAALAAVTAVFDSAFAVVGFADFVALEAIDQLTSIYDEIDAVLAHGLGDAEAAAGLIDECRDAASDLEDGASSATAAATSALVASIMGRVGQVEALLQLAAGAGEEAPTASGTASQRQAATNGYQARRLQGRVALCEAARLARNAELTVYDDAIAMRDALSDLLAADADQVTEADADALAPLRALRVAVVEDITSRAALLPRTTTYTPAGVTPSLVLAWRLYGDPTRGAEIATRNSVAHPGFLPAEPLQVLTA